MLQSKTEGQYIIGATIDLRPCTLEHSETIVKLRNQKKSRYHLNQKEASTIAGQDAWYQRYAQSDDDLYWCIYDKSGRMVGVIRIYDIMPDGGCCNQGSFIIDEACAMGGPYALETEILTLDFCFDALQIDRVLNDDRVENKKMNSISRRVGFRFLEEFERGDARYNLYELTRETYKRADLVKMLSQWGGRA